MPSGMLTSHVLQFSKSHVFSLFFRYDKLPSANAYIDLRKWWIKLTKKENYRRVYAPKFPTLQEVQQAKCDAWEREDILEFEREVTSVRAIQSSVQINNNWYPRNQTCLLILKTPIAETPQELEEILKNIALKGKLTFEFKVFWIFCCISRMGIKMGRRLCLFI